MILKKSLLISAFALLASCSHMPEDKSFVREPAEAQGSCQELAQSLFLKENYEPDLQKALVDKKLISFTSKFVIVEHPKLNWINKARLSLNKSIKNWNNNKYPAFYMFSDDDVVTEAKRYFQTLDSIVTKEVAVLPEATKNLEVVSGWMKSFESYQKDLDNLLDERISLQYNLSLLKKLKLKKDEVRDIKLMVKRNGVMVEEIITLRKSEKDLDYQIKRFKSEIKDLDGTLLKNGKIKDRIVRQAMLADILTILQREFEFAVKNSKAPNEELIKELDNINALIKKSDFQPNTYGVYRITNKVFMREMASLTKLDVAYKKFVQTPVLKFKEVINAYIANRAANMNEADKVGFFKRMYTKVTSITPKQAAIAGGTVAVAGLGVERYFWVEKQKDQKMSDHRIEEVTDPAVEDEMNSAREVETNGATEIQTNGATEVGTNGATAVDSNRAHQEQIDRTKKEEEKISDSHSSVIEVHIDELTE